jgi:hypothetical protein
MSGTRMLFLVAYVLLALGGLFLAAAAKDIGISIFGWGLVLFGVLNAFNAIKVHFDEQEQH